MTAGEIHAAACRIFNEIVEDDPRITLHDLRAMFAVGFADFLRLSPNQSANLKPRMSDREVRTVVYDVIDPILPGQKVIEIMTDLDRAMATRAPKHS